MNTIKIDKFILKYEKFLISLLLIIGIIFIFFRNYSLLPMIMSDEYYSQLNSRFLNLEESTNSNYLFNFIYSLTNYCDSGFYLCAKSINLIFFTIGNIVLYFFFKSTSKVFFSYLIIVSLYLGPINSYTSYFTQESLVFFLFWILSFFFLKLENQNNFLKIIFLITFFFIIDLSKSYGLFFIITFIIYMKVQYYLKNLLFFDFIKIVLFGLFFYLALKYLFILLFNTDFYIISKLHEDNFFKNFDKINFYDLLLIPKYFFINFYGHLITLFSVFGIMIYVNGLYLKNNILIKKKMNFLQKFYLFGLIYIFILISFTALANSITQINIINYPYESIYRIHFRYYVYAIPILMIPIFDKDFNFNQIKLNIYFFTIIFLFFFSSLFFLSFSPYTPYKFDNPYLRGLSWNKIVFIILLFALSANYIQFFFSRKKSLFIFILILFPIINLTSSAYISNEQLYNKPENANIYNKIGADLKNKKIDFDNALILGDYEPGLYEILWYVDSKHTKFQIINFNKKLTFKNISNNLEYLIVVNPKSPLNNHIDKFSVFYKDQNYYIYKKK